MKRVIITGGTGFIGRHLVEELLTEDTQIVLLSIGDSGRKETTKGQNVTHIFVDTYSDVIGKIPNGFDAFFHLGWGGVDSADKNDVKLQLANIQTSLEALMVAKQLDCGLFVGAGTVAEYTSNKDLINPERKQTPNDMYGAAKTAVHYLLEAYAKQIQQNMIWALLPSTYGEGRRTDNIITYTICKLLTGEVPIYGSLEQMWDFLYVKDVARALIAAAEKGIPGMTYGIGSGTYCKLKDYVTQIRDMINPALELGIGQITDATKEKFSSCVNIERIVQDTGWKPETSFFCGMQKTIAYYRKKMGERMDEYLLTIAIPTYNRCELLKMTLDSIICQLPSEIVEVIVCDNASQDNTQEMIQKYVDEYGIKYYRNKECLGMDGNFLKCLERAEGKYIHLMSDDDILLEGALDTILRIIRSESPAYINLNSCAYWQDKSKLSAPRIMLEKTMVTYDKAEYIKRLGVYITYLSATILRKEDFLEIENPQKYMGTHFLHAHIVLDILGKENKKVVITKEPALACKMNNSGGFDLYEVWIRQYKKLLLDTAVKNGFPYKVMKDIYIKDVNGFIKDSILKYSIVENDYIMKERYQLIRHTWMYPSVWVKTWYIAYAPLWLRKKIYEKRQERKRMN